MNQASLVIVTCYGITKDPETNDFMMVTKYARNNLRQYLNKSFNSLGWSDKLSKLRYTALGLNAIHEKGLIHRYFHCGNILHNDDVNWNCGSFITDLGLCKPANGTSQSENTKIYGVLPYVAPEVLRGEEYTQASDIYGFGIIAYEVCTGFPPYHDIAHDEFLAIRICQGLRPKSNYKIPQLVLNAIQQCWDADPLKRPNAKELWSLFGDLSIKSMNFGCFENSTISNQIKEADEINKELPATSSSIGILSYTTHPQAVYTSKLLDFQNLPGPKNADDNVTESHSSN
jgi:serine/threonine protein kinase